MGLVLLGDGIDLVKRNRRYIACKTIYRLSPHITLMAPFWSSFPLTHDGASPIFCSSKILIHSI